MEMLDNPMLETEQDEDSNNIKIPIKDIIEDAMKKSGARYPDSFVMYMRRYFIASLNRRMIEPKDLMTLVAGFTKAVRSVQFKGKHFSFFSYSNKTLSVSFIEDLRDSADSDRDYFAAIFYILSGLATEEKLHASHRLLCGIVGQSIFTMDIHGRRERSSGKMPVPVGLKLLEAEDGYCQERELTSTLLIQMLCAMDIDVDKLIRAAHFKPLVEVFDAKLKDNPRAQLMNEALDVIVALLRKESYSKALQLIDDFQRLADSCFTKADRRYEEFSKLILTDSLRDELKKKKEKQSD